MGMNEKQFRRDLSTLTLNSSFSRIFIFSKSRQTRDMSSFYLSSSDADTAVTARLVSYYGVTNSDFLS